MGNYYNSYSFLNGSLGTILSLAILVLTIIAMWKIFEKAGEPGWAAIIPFYNLYVLFKITWGNGWKFLFLLIPIANIVFAIITMVKLAKAFGKNTCNQNGIESPSGFAVGLIFLSVIFYCILAFDQSQYLGVPKSA